MKFKNFEIKKAMTIFKPLDPNYYDKNFEWTGVQPDAKILAQERKKLQITLEER